MFNEFIKPLTTNDCEETICFEEQGFVLGDEPATLQYTITNL